MGEGPELIVSLPLPSLPLPFCAHRWHTIRQCWLCSTHAGGMALLSWAFLYPLSFLDFTDCDGSMGVQFWMAGLNSLCFLGDFNTVAAVHRGLDTHVSFHSTRPGTWRGHDILHTNWAAPREGTTVLLSNPASAFLFCSRV